MPAVGYSEAIRNARLDAMATEIGGGAKLRIYTGPRPSNAAAITTEVLLAELVCQTPFAGAAVGGVLTVSGPDPDIDADASGLAAWWRLVKADGTTWCMDGDCGTDLTLNNYNIVATQTVEVLTWTHTHGNAA